MIKDSLGRTATASVTITVIPVDDPQVINHAEGYSMAFIAYGLTADLNMDPAVRDISSMADYLIVPEFNRDSVTAADDLQSAAVQYGQSGTGVNALDFNGDRVMDLFDLTILARNMKR